MIDIALDQYSRYQISSVSIRLISISIDHYGPTHIPLIDSLIHTISGYQSNKYHIFHNMAAVIGRWMGNLPFHPHLPNPSSSTIHVERRHVSPPPPPQYSSIVRVRCFGLKWRHHPSHPATQQLSDPTTQPPNHSATQPPSHPAPNHSATHPPSHQATQPLSHPATKPPQRVAGRPLCQVYYCKTNLYSLLYINEICQLFNELEYFDSVNCDLFLPKIAHRCCTIIKPPFFVKF